MIYLIFRNIFVIKKIIDYIYSILDPIVTVILVTSEMWSTDALYLLPYL